MVILGEVEEIIRFMPIPICEVLRCMPLLFSTPTIASRLLLSAILKTTYSFKQGQSDLLS